jgi:hypothetical protein
MAKLEQPDTVGGVKIARALRARRVTIGAVGVLGGAALGALAGPPGVIVGAVIGGTVGALAAGPFRDAELLRGAREDKMDVALGIYDGDVGAPNLEHPPAKVGAFSPASAGAESYSDRAPAEGPIVPPD